MKKLDEILDDIELDLIKKHLKKAYELGRESVLGKEIEVDEPETKKPREWDLCSHFSFGHMQLVISSGPTPDKAETIQVREVFPNTVTVTKEELRKALDSCPSYFGHDDRFLDLYKRLGFKE